MIHSSKIHWGEGLFLRPQHFQRQDAYHEARLAEGMRHLHPYAWGLRRMVVDTDALSSQVLRLIEVQAVLPDGELIHAPADDACPHDVSLSNVPAGTSELVFHLALAPLRSQGGNAAADPQFSVGGVRYAQAALQAPDWFTQAAPAELMFLRRTPRLLGEHEPRDHLVCLPLLRLRRSATGVFELDSRFIAPSLSIAASPALLALLRRLLDALQAKVEALYGHHREPSRHVIEFRSGDVASFWLLHTASAAFASLSHLNQHPGLHPERLYERLLELAGALMTFSRRFALADLRPYDHAAPESAFLDLDGVIRELLETVISTRYFSIALQEVRPSFLHARLDAERIDSATSLFLGVRAATSMSDLVDIVPMRFKVGSPDDVDKLVLSAMSGVRVTHATQVPAAIPVRPGAAYFSIEARGPLYERMLQAQTLALYVPTGIPDIQVELFALTA